MIGRFVNLRNDETLGECAVHRHLSLLIAFGLIFVGGARMTVQAMQQETLLIPTCLGQTLTLNIGHSGWYALHCWGCYAFIFGVMLLAVLAVQKIRQRQTSA